MEALAVIVSYPYKYAKLTRAKTRCITESLNMKDHQEDKMKSVRENRTLKGVDRHLDIDGRKEYLGTLFQ